MKPPPWNQKEAVAKFAINELDEPDPYIDKLPPTRLPRPSDKSNSEIAQLEQLAVEAARDGDFKPLARLIGPIAWVQGGKLVSAVNPSVQQLKEDTWRLVRAKLEGDQMFFELFAKPKKHGGSEKLSRAEREERYKVFDAAREARMLIEILTKYYRREGKRNIRIRACEIAADRYGIKTNLEAHLSRESRYKRR